MNAKATIYVYLLDEAVDVWRPASAEHLRDDIYRIVSGPSDDTERWEFGPGDIVRCRDQDFSGAQRGLAAFERVRV
jgi:hypothetical protein